MSIKINCALNANDGKVYFFVGEKVISYDVYFLTCDIIPRKTTNKKPFLYYFF